MEELRVSLIQTEILWESIEENLLRYTEKIKDLQNTDLIVLPEMFSTGFTMNPIPVAEKESGKAVQWMIQMATSKKIALTGSLVIEENKKYYNRLFFVFPDGSYKTYDKKHLFSLAKEHANYSAGSEKISIDYKGFKICPLICYDLRFPVWARNVEDYDVLIFVANWPHKRVKAWDALLKARSIENMCYTIGVNRVGTDGNDLFYSGHSAIYDILGDQISAPFQETELIQTISLSKKSILEARKNLGFLRDRDEFNLK
ncbi:nitrilase family protein [Mesonia sp. MT50]|uniref:Nitrilase family protein n=1 Tax=Mesonia profundi TaxID=3070998 RepID=A0ABU1A070_9FLAO|nr:nitrilase family protein [Mesonia profundi]MDQ7916299.1 nitrilase family protein [Mesonia profundi]